ncbi:MAG: FprA family A-type flavoprotein [Deltaproteobacteria bacterium]|nr:FprA family A-type flavoprotein [Deltaproteobacteria bacterium]
MISHQLFNDGTRQWYYFGRDPNKPDTLIDTNQYLVVTNGEGLLLDPGGLETFPAVVSILSKEIELSKIKLIFASHQDPDIISSLSLWNGLLPGVDVYVSWLWSTFIPHFGGGQALKSVPDEGMTFNIGGTNDLTLIPAHYLHSSGNFSLYDPRAHILFSGDIGAALLPPGESKFFVEDFHQHTQYMTGFHRRWMPSNQAKMKWIQRVRDLKVNLMCPQHGSIFRDQDVIRFLDWFEELDVGSASK